MDKQFTPGPWEVVSGVHKTTTELKDKGEKWFTVHNEDGVIAEALHGRCLDVDQEQAEANARLIAAAPEMFELLETLLSEPIESAIKVEIRELLTRITTP